MTIDRRKLALIHVAKTKLNLGDDSYRSALVQIGGVASSKDLDQAGFEAMMGFFEYLGFTPLVAKGPTYGRRPGMASFAQIELIRALWAEHTHRAYPGEDQLNAWLEHYFKLSSLRFLSAGAAPKVITALKAMKARAA
jgi:Protein of unknown function (DUF1018)